MDKQMGKVRRSGREARRATRAAPLARDMNPVRPGMEGGKYQLLGDHDVQRIHRAALDVLERIGIAGATESGIQIMTGAGARLTDTGRLTFPRSLVEDVIAGAGRRFPLYAQDPRHDMEPWGQKVYFGTAGAAVSIVDADTAEYRDSTVRDLYDIARTVDALEHIHFFQRAVVCRDVPDPLEMDFNTCYASVLGTSKHVGSSWGDAVSMKKSMEMLHAIAGGEKKWRERPFVSQSNCFVVPPLRFAQESCDCLELAVREGMPVLLVAAGQAGATAPASIAGAVVQEIAECLAGLVYVNAIRPGAPAIMGTLGFVSDLRTGAMSGGSPEQALFSAASVQISQFYDLTAGTVGGISDSKLPDGQAGAEKSCSHTLVGNTGANLIYESAGMLASLLGFSLEQLVIDDDIIGAVQRTIKGIDLSDEALSVETIASTCLEGPNHYLGSDQTLKRMQRDYLYPSLGDRSSPKEWVEKGSARYVETARRKLDAILDSNYPRHIPPQLDDELRRSFPVRLAIEATGRG